MTDYMLATYVWSAIGLSGLIAPLVAMGVIEVARAAHLPLPCEADAA